MVVSLATDMDRAFEADRSLLSVTLAVKEKEPLALGVPEMVPEDDKLRSPGSEPEETDHVYGVVPPVATRLELYDCPIVPPGREEVLMTKTLDETPVPERETIWVPAEALSFTVSAPERVPVAVGVNLTLTVQLALGATGTPIPHVPVPANAKSPLMDILVKDSEEEPVFLIVTYFVELVVSTAWFPKDSGSGERLILVLAWAVTPQANRPSKKVKVIASKAGENLLGFNGIPPNMDLQVFGSARSLRLGLRRQFQVAVIQVLGARTVGDSSDFN